MSHDVIIIGAGPVGLSLAKALADNGLDVVIVEKNTQSSISKPAYDGRETAITHFSADLMQSLGQWQHIPTSAIHAIQKARVLDGHSPYFLHFEPDTTSQKDRLGFMISNHVIRKAAYEAVVNVPNIKLLCGKEVKSLSLADPMSAVHLDDGQTLQAKLVVAADTRLSKMRQLAGVPCDMLDFGRTCIVGKLSITGAHGGIATEWFQYNQTMAFLPLGDKEMSIVITIKSDDSQSVLSLDKAGFADYMHAHVGDKFGDITLESDLHAYPLVATYARRFYGHRFALVGDAAVGMHPVTAHGFNLGLKSVDALAFEIAKARASGQDMGGQQTLAAYNRRHRHASRLIYVGTNQLVKLFTDDRPLAKLARKLCLRLGNHVAPVQHFITKQLTQVPSHRRIAS